MKYIYTALASITVSFKKRILKLFKTAFNISKFVISIKDVKKVFSHFDGRKITHWYTLLDRCIEKINSLESKLELLQANGESNNAYFNRIQKLIQSEGAKYQLVTGTIEAYGNFTMTVYKRLPHPTKMWTDTKLGRLFISKQGQVSIAFSSLGQNMIVPDLQTAFEKLNSRFTPTI